MCTPYRVLGVSESAEDETIRAAYLKAISEFPPDRHPDRFERIRAAYDAISTLERRLKHALFDTTVPSGEDILECLATRASSPSPNEGRLRRVLAPK